MCSSTCDAMTCHVENGQCLDDGFFNPINILFHKITGALEVDQRISHNLARPVVSNLTAAVGGDNGDIARRQDVFGLAGQALGEERGVFAGDDQHRGRERARAFADAAAGGGRS